MKLLEARHVMCSTLTSFNEVERVGTIVEARPFPPHPVPLIALTCGGAGASTARQAAQRLPGDRPGTAGDRPHVRGPHPALRAVHPPVAPRGVSAEQAHRGVPVCAQPSGGGRGGGGSSS
jgi:hypothetical protein